MDSTYVQDGELLTYTNSLARSPGDVVFIGSKCMQVVTACLAGELMTVRPVGVVRVNKAPADVFSVATGVSVHWNATTKLASLVAADGRIGMAVGGGALDDSYVDVLLNG